jgi:hypothetical protein
LNRELELINSLEDKILKLEEFVCGKFTEYKQIIEQLYIENKKKAEIIKRLKLDRP